MVLEIVKYFQTALVLVSVKGPGDVRHHGRRWHCGASRVAVSRKHCGRSENDT
jgi:hypothetical protein